MSNNVIATNFIPRGQDSENARIDLEYAKEALRELTGPQFMALAAFEPINVVSAARHVVACAERLRIIEEREIQERDNDE